MKTKSIIIILIISLFYSCGPKVGKNEKSFNNKVQETLAYTSKINSDKTFKQEHTEGALTDAEGFKDIGKFEYTTYFDEIEKELVHIQNIEITDKRVLESYYFKDNKLFCIQVMDPYDENVQIGGQMKMMIVYPDDSNKSEHHKLLIDKAKRFQREFKTNH